MTTDTQNGGSTHAYSKQAAAPPSAPRQIWLDALKGAAAIMVVMSHVGALPAWGYYVTACYIPLFFIASGYTFKIREHAIRQKFSALVTPYFGWALFYLLLITLRHTGGEPLLYRLLCGAGGVLYSRVAFYPLSSGNDYYLFPDGTTPMWFLTCMAASYLLAKPLFSFHGKRLIALVCVYLLLTALMTCMPVLLPWSIDTAFLGALLIISGYLLKPYPFTSKCALLLVVILLPVYILLVDVNGNINMSVREYGKLGVLSILLFYLISTGGTLIAAGLFRLTERLLIVKGIALIGRSSLTILCAHAFFVALCKRFTPLFNALPAEAVMPVFVVMVIGGCVLTDLAIKRVKVRVGRIR